MATEYLTECIYNNKTCQVENGKCKCERKCLRERTTSLPCLIDQDNKCACLS
jgi:hypothetical protein